MSTEDTSSNQRSKSLIGSGVMKEVPVHTISIGKKFQPQSRSKSNLKGEQELKPNKFQSKLKGPEELNESSYLSRIDYNTQQTE